ncbi:MAG: hypothetical protein V4843_07275 [Pseudomonadota bacterium]|uniref:hypothetical protein n=1 Tax=unclassified Acidovorax TaxID=2684926 RepID=UPI000B2852C6|nr:hypothetical protein [Acidovorax sp. Root267]
MNPLLPPRLTALWRRLRQQLPAQAALAWLLLALVVVPTLGRLHQVEHAGALEQMRAGHALQGAQQATVRHGLSAVSLAEAATPAAASPETGHAHGLLSLLLAPHAPVDCLLLDQLALGDALHSAPQALPAPVPAQAPPVQHAGRSTAPHVALFQARGPPTA